MTKTMTYVELAAIKAKTARGEYGPHGGEDVDALLAEVGRLQESEARLAALLSDVVDENDLDGTDWQAKARAMLDARRKAIVASCAAAPAG